MVSTLEVADNRVDGVVGDEVVDVSLTFVGWTRLGTEEVLLSWLDVDDLRVMV